MNGEGNIAKAETLLILKNTENRGGILCTVT